MERDLIEFVKNYDFLYNKNAQHYYNTVLREKKFEQLACRINFPVQSITKKWTFLKERFFQELNREKSGEEIVNKWKWMEPLRFLEGHAEPNGQEFDSGSSFSSVFVDTMPCLNTNTYENGVAYTTEEQNYNNNRPSIIETHILKRPAFNGESSQLNTEEPSNKKSATENGIGKRIVIKEEIRQKHLSATKKNNPSPTRHSSRRKKVIVKPEPVPEPEPEPEQEPEEEEAEVAVVSTPERQVILRPRENSRAKVKKEPSEKTTSTRTSTRKARGPYMTAAKRTLLEGANVTKTALDLFFKSLTEQIGVVQMSPYKFSCLQIAILEVFHKIVYEEEIEEN